MPRTVLISVGRLRVVLELAAQPADLDVDRAVERARLAVAREIEQPVAGQHLVGVVDKGGEQVEFAGGQPHLLARPARTVRGSTDRGSSRRTAPRRDGAGPGSPVRGSHAPQHAFDPRQQFAQMERLWQIVVGAHLEADDAVDRLAAAGQDDDADTQIRRAASGPASARPRRAASGRESRDRPRLATCAGAYRRRHARWIPGSPRPTDIPGRARRSPSDRRRQEYDRCRSYRPIRLPLISIRPAASKKRSGDREHPYRHHTPGYKFLHKTGPLTSSDYSRPYTPAVRSAIGRSSSVRGVSRGRHYRDIEAEIPRLRRYARALTRDVVAADDLVQDCLARALGKLHLWQEGTDLRAWLFTILHNQYVNQVRRAVREGAAVGLSETEPMLTAPRNRARALNCAIWSARSPSFRRSSGR